MQFLDPLLFLEKTGELVRLKPFGNLVSGLKLNSIDQGESGKSANQLQGLVLLPKRKEGEIAGVLQIFTKPSHAGLAIVLKKGWKILHLLPCQP